MDEPGLAGEPSVKKLAERMSERESVRERERKKNEELKDGEEEK